MPLNIVKPTPGGSDSVWGAMLNTALDAIKAFVDSLESSISGFYTKPGGGIPSTDLTAAVRSSLTKADEAAPTVSPTFTGAVTVPNDSFATSKVIGLPAALAGVSVVVRHDANASFPRPATTASVLWAGSVTPLNATSIDLYVEIAAPPTWVGPLDGFATPHRAVSLRRLLSAYTGPLVRVRRSTDDTELNIGYDSSGNLDTAALAAFVGAGSGYVRTVFDQSGAGRDMGQSANAAQPLLVSAGVNNLLNGKIAAKLDGVDDFLTSPVAGLYAAGAATVAAVLGAAAGSNQAIIIEHSTGAQPFYKIIRSSTAAWQVAATNDANTSLWLNSAAGDTSFDATQHEFFFTDDGSAINTWRDNVAKHAALAAVRAGVVTNTRFSIGAYAATTAQNFANMNFQELVAWTSNRTADRSAIQSAQKSYWGTP